jgi:hypothetical protein
MRWGEHVVHVEEMRTAYKILVGKPEVKTAWETKVKMEG